jgi:uncharacterized protein (DUF305 family)
MLSNRNQRTSRIARGTALLVTLALATPVWAAEPESGQAQDHSQHQGAAATGNKTELSPASKEFEEAMMKMHKDMTIPYTNDVDVDFVRGMMPHHQGAIDQANVFLKYTKDLRLRRLALGIIAAQRKEIRFMQRWLKEHEKGLAPGEAPASLDDPSPDDAAPSSAAPAPAR